MSERNAEILESESLLGSEVYYINTERSRYKIFTGIVYELFQIERGDKPFLICGIQEEYNPEAVVMRITDRVIRQNVFSTKEEALTVAIENLREDVKRLEEVENIDNQFSLYSKVYYWSNYEVKVGIIVKILQQENEKGKTIKTYGIYEQNSSTSIGEVAKVGEEDVYSTKNVAIATAIEKFKKDAEQLKELAGKVIELIPNNFHIGSTVYYNKDAEVKQKEISGIAITYGHGIAKPFISYLFFCETANVVIHEESRLFHTKEEAFAARKKEI